MIIGTVLYKRNTCISVSEVDYNVIVDMFYFRYYQFDSVVVREILGRKLSSRNRKDMDDVSEKTRIPIRSCRRQVCTGKTLACHDVPGKLSLVTMYLQNFLQSGYTSKTFSSQDVRQNVLLSGCPAITFSCNNVSAKHSLVRMSQQSVLLSECTGKTFSCQGVLA